LGIDDNASLWCIESDSGERYRAPNVILAMGGKSFPAVGTDGKGYQLAQELGHTLRPTYPALTPLTGTAKKPPSIEVNDYS
jgi:predicted flavoprotein YhiN